MTTIFKSVFLGTVFFTCINLINASEPIDRMSVVRRHNILTMCTNPQSPAQVGNGKFAFGMDITGLQTFVPFNTLSDWSWHSFPMPKGMSISDYKPVVFESYGKKIPYMDNNPECKDITSWLSMNPHRYNLGRIGFRLLDNEGKEITKENEIKHPSQKIDLWTGLVNSRFELNKKAVFVQTTCHPNKDMVAVSVQSELLPTGTVSVFLDYPYPDSKYFRDYVGRYDTVRAHKTSFEWLSKNTVRIEHIMDSVCYYTTLHWESDAIFQPWNKNDHRYILIPKGDSKTFSFTCQYSQEKVNPQTESVIETEKESADSWIKYWKSGAAIDFSGSKDYRWIELERRVILSQYIMRINECGQFPPQESGLVSNTWYGRFHLEMTWWHIVHYALWNRPKQFESCLGTYEKYLPEAIKRAQSENREGARWPKCTGNFNREWPCSGHAYIVWHEPHPIYFAELEYRLHPTKETLNKWKDVVFRTAQYMADYPFYDKKKKSYVLGPPIVIVSENTDWRKTQNPIFELEYWRYGLDTAIKWCERLSISVPKKWKEVLNHLSPLPQEDSLYVTYKGISNMWTEHTYEHPALIGIYGMLPGEGVDKNTFKRTFDKVYDKWQLDRVWGWDFPMMAMAAARLGETKRAIDILFPASHQFFFDEHGLATGGPFPYFPSNGALLTAIGMMCEGWSGSVGDAPGFPKDGSWKIRYEGFLKME